MQTMSALTLQDKVKPEVEKIDHDPFAGGEIERLAPLTGPQQEIWLACAIGGEEANLAYNESISLELKGPLQYGAMERALLELVERHESLRGTISQDGKFLCIGKNVLLDYQFDDITTYDYEERKKYLDDFSLADENKLFDLQSGPLLRCTLFRLEEELHLLRITAHHIICDGWSFGVLVNELSHLYSSFVRQQPVALDKAASFGEYAESLLNYSTTKEHLDTEKYWVDKYRNRVPVLDLPIDFERPPVRTYKSRRDDFLLSNQLVMQLRQCANRSGCSLVVTLLSAFEVYLHRLTGETEIVLGLPAAGQAVSGNFNLVGHCVNMLPLQSFPDGNFSFEDYLKKRKAEILDDFDHQQYTFGSLLQKLNIPRDPSRVPLIPVIFNIDIGKDMGTSFEGLSYRLISNPRSFETFDLFLNITNSNNEFILEWSYNSQLFRPRTIARMMSEFESLLTTVTAKPEIQLKDLPVGKSGLMKQLALWNDTHADYPVNKTVYQLIHEQALACGTKTAIFFKNRQLTYQEIDQQSSDLAAYLIWSGIEVGDVVGLAVDRSPEMVLSLLGILKAGAAYVPLDPHYPKERIEFMLADAGAKLLLTTAKHKDKFKCEAEVQLLEEIWPRLKMHSSPFMKVPVSGNDLAYILYTSGSTGQPKGVQIEHHSLTNLLLSVQKKPGICSDDRLLAITTISFDIAGTELYLPLISGAYLILADTEEAKDSRSILQKIKDNHISILQATPQTWRMMLESGWNEKLPIKAISTGEALPKDLARRLLPLCDALWNGYGPTETTIWSSVKKLEPSEDMITIGRPVDNTQFYILDEFMGMLPIGASGEIYIAGDGLARGYKNRRDLTEEKFLHFTTPNGNSVRVYRTGDLGKYKANGEIVCLGRADNQLKINGYRIEPGEIEYGLMQHEAIANAVVESKEGHLGETQLVAYLVLKSDTRRGKDSYTDRQSLPEMLIQQCQELLKAYLPPYMVPTFFVGLTKLPLTANGKIDRKKLPLPVWEQVVSLKEEASQIEESLKCLDGVRDAFIETESHPVSGQTITAYIAAENRVETPTAELPDAGKTSSPFSMAYTPQTVARIAAIQAANCIEISNTEESFLQSKISGLLHHYTVSRLTDFLEDASAVFHTTDNGNNIIHLPAMDKPLAMMVVLPFSLCGNAGQLLQFMEKLISRFPLGTCLYIQGIKGKAVKQMRLANDMLQITPAETSIQELKTAIQKEWEKQSGFCLDPAFFFSLSEKLPEIAHIDIQLAADDAEAPDSYDAWIYIGTDKKTLHADLQLDWAQVASMDNLTTILNTYTDKMTVVSNIPCKGTFFHHNLMKSLDGLAPMSSVRTLVTDELRFLSATEVYEPQQFQQLGEKQQQQVFVRWSDDGSDGCFEAVFIPMEASAICYGPIPSGIEIKPAQPLNAFLPNKVHNHLQEQKIQAWKEELKKSLPSYMVPSLFVVVENNFPKTPDGQVDKAALYSLKEAVKQETEKEETEKLSPSERTVLSVWKQIMKLSHIQLDSNFFKLGGHSMLAVKVMLAIEKETGLKLPLSVLFENPTVRKLAKMIEADPQDISWNSLVPIKASGSKSPVYMVHGAGLNVLVFRGLAAYLDKERPLYGLQGIGLNGKQELPDSIEGIAAQYVSEILHHNPEGPYVLFGYSLGGIIVYEMARQLLDMGKTVKMLGIMDTATDIKYARGYKGRSLGFKLVRLGKYIRYDVKRYMHSPFRVFQKEMSHKCVRLLQILHVAQPPPPAEKNGFSYEGELISKYHEALHRYQLRPIPIKLTLFRSIGPNEFVYDSRLLGWEKLALKGIEVFDMPGNHKSFLYPPYDSVFAKVMQESLDPSI